MYITSLLLLRIPSTARLASFESSQFPYSTPFFLHPSLPSLSLSLHYSLSQCLSRFILHFSLHVLTPFDPFVAHFALPTIPRVSFLYFKFYPPSSIPLPHPPGHRSFWTQPHLVEAPLSCPSLFHILPLAYPSPSLSPPPVSAAVSAPLCPPLPRSYLFGRLYLLSYLLVRFYRGSARCTCRLQAVVTVEWRLVSSKGAQNRPTPIHDARLVGPANWNCINSFLRRLLKR